MFELIANRQNSPGTQAQAASRFADFPILPMSAAAEIAGVSVPCMERAATRRRILAGVMSDVHGMELLVLRSGVERYIEDRQYNQSKSRPSAVATDVAIDGGESPAGRS